MPLLCEMSDRLRQVVGCSVEGVMSPQSRIGWVESLDGWRGAQALYLSVPFFRPWIGFAVRGRGLLACMRMQANMLFCFAQVQLQASKLHSARIQCVCIVQYRPCRPISQLAGLSVVTRPDCTYSIDDIILKTSARAAAPALFLSVAISISW